MFQHVVALLNLSRAFGQSHDTHSQSLPSYIKDSNQALEIFQFLGREQNQFHHGHNIKVKNDQVNQVSNLSNWKEEV